MPIFKITRKETSHEYAFIEADDVEKAKEYAYNSELVSWHPCQDYDCEIVKVFEETDPGKLKGRIIEKDDGSYNFK